MKNVQQKSEKTAREASRAEVNADKPGGVCCPKLYREDIWTPQHFKTNVMDWFLDMTDEELLCRCKENSSSTLNDTSNVEKSSTDHRDSTSDIYSDVQPSYSSDAYCQCGSGIDNEEMETYAAQSSGSSGSSILSLCSICSNATLCSNCKLSSYKENSDHRLDDQPDLTICKKCAADRKPETEVYKNVAYHKYSQMLDLDKYCHYKDWDAIYRIRTKIPDDEQIIQVDKGQLMMRGEDVPLKLHRQDHQITEADRNIFTDGYKPPETWKISLNNEYRREYGLNIKIHQPQHYSCEDSKVTGYKPMQLML